MRSTSCVRTWSLTPCASSLTQASRSGPTPCCGEKYDAFADKTNTTQEPTSDLILNQIIEAAKDNKIYKQVCPWIKTWLVVLCNAHGDLLFFTGFIESVPAAKFISTLCMICRQVSSPSKKTGIFFSSHLFWNQILFQGFHFEFFHVFQTPPKKRMTQLLRLMCLIENRNWILCHKRVYHSVGSRWLASIVL